MIKFLLTILALLILLIGCSKDQPTSYQGYVEGEYVNIASSQSGRLDKLFVTRGEEVNISTPLFALDSENESSQLHQNESELASAQAVLTDMEKGSRNEELNVIKAQLTQAIANAKNAHAQFLRTQELYNANASSKEILDNATASEQQSSAAVVELQERFKVAQLGDRKDRLQAQKGKIAQIQSQIAQASWRLREKALKSPSQALVFDTLYCVGEFVPVGGIVVRLLPPQNRKIRFFIPQNVAEKLSIRQAIYFQPMNTTKTTEGHITYISPEAEYTPPLIYSNESKERLLFMVEAYPLLQDAPHLHPGQPIRVILHEPAR
jgi:HlyD family secretion protein